MGRSDVVGACRGVISRWSEGGRRLDGRRFAWLPLLIGLIAMADAPACGAETVPQPLSTVGARCGAAQGVLPRQRPDNPLSPDEECGLQRGDGFRECAHCPSMVVVPRGAFTMGSPQDEQGRTAEEGPQHVVRLAHPFAVGKYHVTVEEFAVFIGETGYDMKGACYTFTNGEWSSIADQDWRHPGFPQGRNHPVACVAWHDAVAYAMWLSWTTGHHYRLLSEAEWEYAARGRTEPGRYSPYFFGADQRDLCLYGNGADQAVKREVAGAANWSTAPCDDGYAYTSPVGSYLPNAFGLYDMLGNLWQWVQDCYKADYDGAPGGGTARSAADCSRRVMRGGSWYNYPRFLRAAYRTWCTDVDRLTRGGFRVARDLAVE